MLCFAVFPFGRNDGWECSGDFKIAKPSLRHFDQKKCLFINLFRLMPDVKFAL